MGKGGKGGSRGGDMKFAYWVMAVTSGHVAGAFYLSGKFANDRLILTSL